MARITNVRRHVRPPQLTPLLSSLILHLSTLLPAPRMQKLCLCTDAAVPSQPGELPWVDVTAWSGW